MDEPHRRGAGPAAPGPALGLALGLALLAAGCGGRPQTGQVVEDVPGQAEGQQASMEEMQRLMKKGNAR